MRSDLTRRARERVQHTIESILVMLLDRLVSEDTPAQVSLFVGRDSRGLLLAEAARDNWCPRPAQRAGAALFRPACSDAAPG